jgi:hypothetical protein
MIRIPGARHTAEVGAALPIAGSRLCSNVWPQSAAWAAPASQTNFIILDVRENGARLDRPRTTAMEAATAVFRFHLTTSMIDKNVPSFARVYAGDFGFLTLIQVFDGDCNERRPMTFRTL